MFAPDPKIGQELRHFFLDLLDGKNLVAYHEGRDKYISGRRQQVIGDKGLGDEAERLLREGTLQEIEEQVMAVEGSHKAVPLFIISPPY